MRVFPDLTVDGEFKALGDTGVSGSLNDRQYDYLGNSGYTGSLPDRFGEYSGFTPASLFSSASSRGFMFDFRDYNTLFTDTTGTTRVTSTGQSVARVNDKSGLGNHATQTTLGNRPLSVIFPSSGVRNRANGSADVGNGSIWASPLVSNGITHTRVASGFDTDGLPYVDYSVVGTASANAIVGLYTTAFSRNGASLGQQWTGSVIAQIISGSAPPSSSGLRVDLYGETAPSTGTEAFVGTLSRSNTAVTVSNSATLANAATNQIRVDVVARTEAGATVNYTIRIKALQFELGSSRTSYQFNYSAQNVTEPGFTSIRGIQFNGIDQWLQTAAIDFSNSDEVTVVAGVRKLSDAATGMVAELTATSSGTNGAFALFAPSGALANYTFRSRGTTVSDAAITLPQYAAPHTSVLSGSGKISTDAAALRVNGALAISSATDQGTGNFSNAIVYIGRRGGTSLPFNGVLTFLFVINRLLTANELAAVEAYANGRTVAF